MDVEEDGVSSFDVKTDNVSPGDVDAYNLNERFEDESESDDNHVVDLSSSELVYITQKLSITNDIVTCSNIRGVIQVDDDENNTCYPIVNE